MVLGTWNETRPISTEILGIIRGPHDGFGLLCSPQVNDRQAIERTEQLLLSSQKRLIACDEGMRVVEESLARSRHLIRETHHLISRTNQLIEAIDRCYHRTPLA